MSTTKTRLAWTAALLIGASPLLYFVALVAQSLRAVSGS